MWSSCLRSCHWEGLVVFGLGWESKEKGREWGDWGKWEAYVQGSGLGCALDAAGGRLANVDVRGALFCVLFCMQRYGC